MRRLILLTILGLGTTAAQADNSLFYLGGGVTDTSLTDSYGGYIAWTPSTVKNPSWKTFAGVRPLNWLGAEVDYIDLGTGSGGTFGDTFFSTTTAHNSAWAAYAVGFVPLPVVDLYAKVGAARWKVNATYTSFIDGLPAPVVATMHYSGTSFAGGIGVQAHVKIFGVRLEYEAFQVNGNTASIGSLSAFLSF